MPKNMGFTAGMTAASPTTSSSCTSRLAPSDLQTNTESLTNNSQKHSSHQASLLR